MNVLEVTKNITMILKYFSILNIFSNRDREEYPSSKRPPRGVLRTRAQQLVTQETLEHRGSVERIDQLHQDFATLSCEVRSAIQTFQMLATNSPHSNPNFPTPVREGSGVLARSSSHPPDALCWNQPSQLVTVACQTDWPTEFLEAWVRSDPHRVLRILGLNPELILKHTTSPTPSTTSPPPPPYEPLSPLGGSPTQSPSHILGRPIII